MSTSALSTTQLQLPQPREVEVVIIRLDDGRLIAREVESVQLASEHAAGATAKQ